MLVDRRRVSYRRRDDRVAVTAESLAAPFLLTLAQSNESSNEVREAATAAFHKLDNGPSASASPGDLFYGLAKDFYYNNATIKADPRSPKAFVWQWKDHGLVSKAIPPQIFNDLMAMRVSEYSLRQSPSNPDRAVSLWLAANIRRGLDLPAGETDPTRGADEPAAHYYNVAEGAGFVDVTVLRTTQPDAKPAMNAPTISMWKAGVTWLTRRVNPPSTNVTQLRRARVTAESADTASRAHRRATGPCRARRRRARAALAAAT